MYLPDFVLRTTLPKKQPKIKDLPTPEEVLNAIKDTDVELPVLLALWLGMRLSEIQGLRFSDVSPNGIITISHVRVVVDGTLKVQLKHIIAQEESKHQLRLSK